MSLLHAHGHGEHDPGEHGHDHDHGPGRGMAAHHGEGTGVGPGGAVARESQSRRLGWVFGLTAVFMVAEVVGGIMANSLALLADAGHMLTDVGALGLSMFAMRMAQRPPSPEKTYGYVRTEILAALLNGATLAVIAAFIVREAWERLQAPPEVDGPLMLGVAAVGLAVNVAGAFLLHSHAHDNLNVRGAYLHVLGDLLGSVGALVAGGVILLTGWTLVDPLVSVLIAALLVVSGWRLVRESADILMEAAPSHVDVEGLLEELGEVEGVSDVHDLHVWTLTSGFVAMSGHGVIDEVERLGPALDAIQERARAHGIRHVTFQLEPRALVQIRTSPGRGGGSAAGP